MSAYFTNDVTFDLPDGMFVDRTMTNLVLSSEGSVDVVLLGERRRLPPGRTLREMAAEHARGAAERLRGYTVLFERESEGCAVPALELAARWRVANGAPIYSRWVHLLFGSTWLTLICEGPLAGRERCDANLDRVLASLQPRA